MVINRIDQGVREELERYDKKDTTFNWVFPDKTYMRTHLTSYHYSTPEGIQCDADCNYKEWKKKWQLKSKVFLSQKSLG